jgi:hypothetical protein
MNENWSIVGGIVSNPFNGNLWGFNFQLKAFIGMLASLSNYD